MVVYAEVSSSPKFLLRRWPVLRPRTGFEGSWSFVLRGGNWFGENVGNVDPIDFMLSCIYIYIYVYMSYIAISTNIYTYIAWYNIWSMNICSISISKLVHVQQPNSSIGSGLVQLDDASLGFRSTSPAGRVWCQGRVRKSLWSKGMLWVKIVGLTWSRFFDVFTLANLPLDFRFRGLGWPGQVASLQEEIEELSRCLA